MVTSSLFRLEDVTYMGLHYEDVSLEKNVFTCVSGKSGTGKSSLLKLLNKTHSPHTGRILYAGTDIAQLESIAYRKKVMLCGQDSYLENLSIRENFHSFYAYREEDCLTDAQIEHYLALASFTPSLDAQASTLSGGEAKRVHLAITLSFAPQVLLLDEVTSPLDDETAQKVFMQLQAHANEQGMTVIFVTHNPYIASTFSENTLVLGG